MRRLRENNAKRAQLLKDQNKKSLNYDRTTFTLIVVLGVFLLTELPQGVLTILNGIFTNDVHTVFYMNLANLLDLLSLINCYVGFLAYCFLCTKYQQTFVLMIFTWLDLLICYYRSGILRPDFRNREFCFFVGRMLVIGIPIYLKNSIRFLYFKFIYEHCCLSLLTLF
ncbi:unnamed protein product [Meloidogyne enterolobii]